MKRSVNSKYFSLQSAIYFFDKNVILHSDLNRTWIWMLLLLKEEFNTFTQRKFCTYKKPSWNRHELVIGFILTCKKRPRLHCGKCPKPSSSCSWWIRLPPILGIEKPESITIFQFWRPAGRSRRGVKHQPIFYTSPSLSLSLSALQTRLLDGAIAHWSKFKVVNFIKLVRILNF